MILHIDLNSFFARAEQQANTYLRDRPIGVLGKGHKGARTCVVAASPEAKKPWGVKSGMSVGEVQRLCPGIILVPPDYSRYLDISRRFISILDRFSPWVEIFSIDEAFVALRRDNQIHNFELVSPEAINVARAIKYAMLDELGELITASIGIAWGKIFAKLAGELQKPDGLVVLEPATWLRRVGNLPVTELCGIGAQLTIALRELKIQTIDDLTLADAGRLAARFGPSLGLRLWQIGQGIDSSPVIPHSNLAPAKSIGHQITLDRATAWITLWPMIAKLTTKVGRRLRRANLRTARLTLHVAFGAGGGWGERVNLTQAMADNELLTAARWLVSQFPFRTQTPIRRVGIVASDLKPTTGLIALPLFPQHAAGEAATIAADALRDRFGEAIIGWGNSFATEIGDLRDWRGARATLGI